MSVISSARSSLISAFFARLHVGGERLAAFLDHAGDFCAKLRYRRCRPVVCPRRRAGGWARLRRDFGSGGRVAGAVVNRWVDRQVHCDTLRLDILPG